MKEIGRTSNVTKEMTDKVFAQDHKGIAVADNVGTKVMVDAFCIYEKSKAAGDDVDGYVLKFWDTEGNDWYTSSAVFVKSFMRMAKLQLDMEYNLFPEPMQVTIKKVKSSKTGRDYYDIEEAPSKEPSQAWKEIDW